MNEPPIVWLTVAEIAKSVQYSKRVLPKVAGRPNPSGELHWPRRYEVGDQGETAFDKYFRELGRWCLHIGGNDQGRSDQGDFLIRHKGRTVTVDVKASDRDNPRDLMITVDHWKRTGSRNLHLVVDLFQGRRHRLIGWCTGDTFEREGATRFINGNYSILMPYRYLRPMDEL